MSPFWMTPGAHVSPNPRRAQGGSAGIASPTRSHETRSAELITGTFDVPVLVE